MSLVVAIKTDQGIVMGCDSQVSFGNNKYRLTNDESCKIWNIINCPYGLMGGVGFLRDNQLISAHPIINPERIITDSIDFDYVVCDLYSCLCDILESYHRISLEPRCDESGNFIPPILNNEFIFAYKDKAYEISQEGCVRSIDDYLVIGSGADVAVGVLDNNQDKTPEDRIVEAISTCYKNTLYVDNNVVLFYTYDIDCEDLDCEECQRKNYCGYYLEGTDELPEEHDIDENISETTQAIPYDNSIEEPKKRNKKIKKQKPEEENKERNISKFYKRNKNYKPYSV